jgi:hypothetical protein
MGAAVCGPSPATDFAWTFLNMPLRSTCFAGDAASVALGFANRAALGSSGVSLTCGALGAAVSDAAIVPPESAARDSCSNIDISLLFVSGAACAA